MSLVTALSFVSCDKDDKEESSNGDENQIYSNHLYVDLGLPSGTLWATYNIGATKLEEYGDYFAWGETAPKEVYDWSTYKWAIAKYNAGSNEYDWDSITKYNKSDNLSVLLPEDDAATANWGKDWRMPTYEEQIELRENCYMVWTGTGVIFYKAKNADDKGVFVEEPSSDYSVSSDAHVFLPAAGYRWGDEFWFVGHLGYRCYYWSSSLDEDEPYSHFLRVFFKGTHTPSQSRDIGCPVRAVRAK